MKELSKSFKIQVPTPIVYNFIRSEGGKAGEVISDFPSFGLKVKTETLIEDEAERKLVYETKAYGTVVLLEYSIVPDGSGTKVNIKMSCSGMSYSMNELKVMFYPYVSELFSMEWGFEKGKKKNILMSSLENNM